VEQSERKILKNTKKSYFVFAQYWAVIHSCFMWI